MTRCIECTARSEGRNAYAAGLPIENNPYDWSASGYTEEGIKRDNWMLGWRDTWFAEDFPAARWPEMADSLAVVEHRAAVELRQQQVGPVDSRAVGSASSA